MDRRKERFEFSDTSTGGFAVRLAPTLQQISGVYICNSNSRTFDEVMTEGPEPDRLSDEWLTRNIRESMEKNADFWSELAKY